MTFGIAQRRRPIRVERHQTPSWGWRWSCASCEKAETQIATWHDAMNAAGKHACAHVGGTTTITLGLAPHVWTSARRYRGWL